MKIGIIGASGKAGNLILKEAMLRGHDVTAFVRDKSKIRDNVTVIERDVFDLSAKDIADLDVVVNAFGVYRDHAYLHGEVGQKLFPVFQEVATTRLVYVGGAGSLYTDETKGQKVLEAPWFTQLHIKTASAMSDNFDHLAKTTGFSWVYLCPAEYFDPDGKRTGRYHTNIDVQIRNSEKQSYLSYADYAIAVLDEIENPQFENKKISIVGERG